MRAVAHVALVAATLWMPHAAWAQASSPRSTAKVIAMLSHYERMPDASVFVSSGDAMAATLAQLYTEDAQPTFIRVRALRALSFFPERIAAELLREVAADPSAKAVFIHEAAAGLVRCLGARALEFVAPLLARHDSRVRLSAIEALARLEGSEVRTVLTARQATEANAEVRAALDAALLSTSDR